MSIGEKDKKYVWHPFTQMKTASDALPIVKGEGTLLYDDKGQAYIDAIASWWVNLHGHSHPHITAKVHDQMKSLEHIPFAGFTHKPAVELCEKLSAHLPANQQKFFFSGDGSSAVEIALKMSIQYWRNKGHANDPYDLGIPVEFLKRKAQTQHEVDIQSWPSSPRTPRSNPT